MWGGGDWIARQLVGRVDANELSQLVHKRLHTAAGDELLGLLRRPPRARAAHAGKVPIDPPPRYRLVDEETGQTRTTSRTDSEFLDNHRPQYQEIHRHP
jgi:hypothetical protein